MPENVGYSENSEIVFFDDFSLDHLDLSKWNIRVTGRTVNQEQQAYVDSNETLYIAAEDDNPVLVIHPRSRPGFRTPEGKKFDFISGRIDTRNKFDFTYGTASARMKLTAGLGLWPAFWALGKDRWPDTGEIDIMEFVGEADWVSAAVHGPKYFGETGLVNNYYFSLDNDATQWHTYSVEWAPAVLNFLVDDVLTYRVTRSMVDFHGAWAFDNQKYLILNFALGGLYPFKVNGIKKPYYGLPKETVQLIKEDRAKVLVDWVRVTKSYGMSGIET